MCDTVRPLEFCKESEEKIQSDHQILMGQINNIEPFVANVIIILMGDIWKQSFFHAVYMITDKNVQNRAVTA